MKRTLITFVLATSLSLVLLANSAQADLESPILKNNYQLTAEEQLAKDWAERLRLGGYIVHFRHAQREQWIDVTAFDAFELIKGVDASKTTFSKATCLTDQGKEEAKLLGKAFVLASVSFSKVVSSPSCRARQTSLLAFKRIDLIANSLLHRSAIPKVQHEAFDSALRDLLMTLKLKPGSNIALVGHISTLVYRDNTVLDAVEGANGPVETRDPTGFVILERVGDKIYPRYVFKSMKDFTIATLLVPLK